jgi:hypothetical protein
MNQRENVIFNIEHYQNELFESYSLLKFLENQIIPNNQEAEKELELTIKHIKYISFFTSCFLDIATTIKGLIDCEIDWERKFYLKNGFVSIYETINTFNKHQKEILSLISEDYESFEPLYKDLQKKLKAFKKEHKYEEVIGKFRNTAGAHYDENFVEYFTSLNGIDKPNSVKTISDFSNFLMSLIDFWSKLIDVLHQESENRRKK